MAQLNGQIQNLIYLIILLILESHMPLVLMRIATTGTRNVFQRKTDVPPLQPNPNQCICIASQVHNNSGNQGL